MPRKAEPKAPAEDDKPPFRPLLQCTACEELQPIIFRFKMRVNEEFIKQSRRKKVPAPKDREPVLKVSYVWQCSKCGNSKEFSKFPFQSPDEQIDEHERRRTRRVKAKRAKTAAPGK